MKLGRETKNTSKNSMETDKKNKTKKEKNDSFAVSLKAVEKLVLPNPSLLINNKAPQVLDVQVEYIPLKIGNEKCM